MSEPMMEKEYKYSVYTKTHKYKMTEEEYQEFLNKRDNQKPSIPDSEKDSYLDKSEFIPKDDF